MRWDEERFGLECDLDHYMIVAVGDFNMGAMENKGLNIFNTKYVLARADVATDVDFENIDRVVAHEYFHNWTGNRVTCRDWFQLSLKEGLTVFRDQEFGADLHNRSIARIREVRGLRAAQFPEDAGPMAHPVRPSSFVEINNFYTATVYEKGAEVIRMIQTLIGRDGFRKGMDEYFRRHDGQAVTCEDFVAAMAAASGFDFTQFMRWYNQPGTPHVAVDGYFDAETRTCTLTCTQANPRASDEQPYLIPIRVALFTGQGELIAGSERLLQLTANTQSFVFNDVDAEPIPSLLRDFSAPVDPRLRLHAGAVHRSAGPRERPVQRLGSRPAPGLDVDPRRRGGDRRRPVTGVAGQLRRCRPPPAADAGRARRRLRRRSADPARRRTLAEMRWTIVDPDALHAARNGLRRHLAERLEAEFSGLYAALAPQTSPTRRPAPRPAAARCATSA